MKRETREWLNHPTRGAHARDILNSDARQHEEIRGLKERVRELEQNAGVKVKCQHGVKWHGNVLRCGKCHDIAMQRINQKKTGR